MVYVQPGIHPENKIILDFEIQKEHVISARQPELVIVNKKENLPNSGLCRPGRLQVRIERKGKER